MENKEIIIKENTDIITEKEITKYLDAFNMGHLTNQEKLQFIEIAKAFQLNPFKKEIYCIPYNTKDGRKLSILTGYEVYLKRAERLGVLDGWNVRTEGKISDNSLKAIITIYRKDRRESFIHEVWYAEYKQDTSIWRSKPITMIKKVAIAQGFRLCFPLEFGGMPYTSDELPEEMTDIRPAEKTGYSEILENKKMELQELLKNPIFENQKGIASIQKKLEKDYKNNIPESELLDYIEKGLTWAKELIKSLNSPKTFVYEENTYSENDVAIELSKIADKNKKELLNERFDRIMKNLYGSEDFEIAINKFMPDLFLESRGAF